MQQVHIKHLPFASCRGSENEDNLVSTLKELSLAEETQYR